MHGFLAGGPAVVETGPASCEPAARRWLRAALDRPPYDGRVAVMRADGVPAATAVEAAVCMPVQDEAALLPRALDAIAAAVRAAPCACLVVAVVNNTADASAGIVREWAVRTGIASLCLEVRLAPPAANVAVARRLALDCGAALAAADAVLMSTDADTVVPPDWIVRMLAAVRDGAALVAGGITVADAELDALPPAVRRAGVVEWELGALYERIWTRLGGEGTCPLLIGPGGANLAVSAAAYRAVGGLPTDARNEDRALAAAVARHGLPVVALREALAITSGRLDARAAHGLADALVERCHSPDPHVDGTLLPAAAFVASACALRLAGAPASPLRPEVARRLALASEAIWGGPSTEGSVAVAIADRRLLPRLTVADAVTQQAAAASLLARIEAGTGDPVAAALSALDG